MRSWNFITFDQINGQVTSRGKNEAGNSSAARRSLRVALPALILTAVLAGGVGTVQTQSVVAGTKTAATISLPMESIASNEALQPPFHKHFSALVTSAFISSHAEVLRAIAAVGSTNNTSETASAVVPAIVAAEPDYKWEFVSRS